MKKVEKIVTVPGLIYNLCTVLNQINSPHLVSKQRVFLYILTRFYLYISLRLQHLA